ncbi:MAG: hypothetical protein DBX44_06600 [Oscillospiraceae bacterium]|nr:MAG: hypothetical protein DBX44_06600 [Oscillospiraceae bacterium]
MTNQARQGPGAIRSGSFFFFRISGQYSVSIMFTFPKDQPALKRFGFASLFLRCTFASAAT